MARLRDLAARGGDQADPVQHGRELAAPRAVAALPLERAALNDAADPRGQEGDRRHVDRHEGGGQDRGAVVARHQVDPAGDRRAEGLLQRPVRGRARPVEQLDRLAALDQRRRDEPHRRHGPEEAHHQADQSAVEVVRADVEALVDGVRQPRLLAVGPAVAHQVEGDALVGEDLGVEAGDEPSARPAMQRGRHQMPDREARRSGDRDAEVGHRGEQDHAGRARRRRADGTRRARR